MSSCTQVSPRVVREVTAQVRMQEDSQPSGSLSPNHSLHTRALWFAQFKPLHPNWPLTPSSCTQGSPSCIEGYIVRQYLFYSYSFFLFREFQCEAFWILMFATEPFPGGSSARERFQNERKDNLPVIAEEMQTVHFSFFKAWCDVFMMSAQILFV